MDFSAADISIQSSKLGGIGRSLEANLTIKSDTLLINMYDFCELSLAGTCPVGIVQLSGLPIKCEEIKIRTTGNTNG